MREAACLLDFLICSRNHHPARVSQGLILLGVTVTVVFELKFASVIPAQLRGTRISQVTTNRAETKVSRLFARLLVRAAPAG
jgi:hypothetical protein